MRLFAGAGFYKAQSRYANGLRNMGNTASKRSGRLLFVLALTVGILLVGCGPKKEFAEIKSGETLRLECVLLLQKYRSGEIPKAQWPRSVQELKPIRVTAEQNSVRIWVKRPKFSGGYQVFAEPQYLPSTKGTWIQKTEFKGIYIFQSY